jgi:ADP-dependent phosphofructokinase/glucokinase
MELNWEEVWKSLSKQSIEKAYGQLASKSVFGGFNVLVDIVQQLTSDELRQLISDIPIEPGISLNHETFRTVISSHREFVEMLIACVVSGESKEVPVGERDVFEWLNRRWAKSDKFRVGGQPGHMALAACHVVRKIILAGWPTPARFAGLIPPEIENIYLIIAERDGPRLRHIGDCRDPAGKNDYANWAISFCDGLKVCIGDSGTKCPKAGRFIANWYPRAKWMDGKTAECFDSIDIQATHAFLSGFQSLCPDVDPEEQWRGQVLEFMKTIHALQDRVGCRSIHYEMGNMNPSPLLETLVTDLLPEVDSVGCNEAELADMLRAIGEEELASRINVEMSIENVYEGASHLVQRSELQRLHVHTWPFHVSVSQAGLDAHAIERDALLFGAVMGAAKTYAEPDIQKKHIRQGLNIPFSEKGMKLVKNVHGKPEDLGTLVEHGIFQAKNDTLVCVVPGRVRRKLRSTVGLGDTLSSMAFLAATADGGAAA